MNQAVPFPDLNYNGYLFSFDAVKLQPEVIHDYLSQQSYWAGGIPLATVIKSLQHSICLGIYKKDQLIGFGRMITDQATYGYLADIFVLETHRGRGLAKKMVDLFCQLADGLGLRRSSLATKDAHELYAPFGFAIRERPDEIMDRKGISY